MARLDPRGVSLHGEWLTGLRELQAQLRATPVMRRWVFAICAGAVIALVALQAAAETMPT
jgi:hypothetical protein